MIDPITLGIVAYLTLLTATTGHLITENAKLRKTRAYPWKLVIYSKSSKIIGTLEFRPPYKRRGNVIILSDTERFLEIENGDPKAYELISAEGLIVARGIATTTDSVGGTEGSVLRLQVNAPNKKHEPWKLRVIDFSFKPSISSWEEINNSEEYDQGPESDDFGQ